MQAAIDHSQGQLFETLTLYPGEIQVFQKPDDLTTAEWAEEAVYIPRGATPGPFNFQQVPHIRGVLEIADRPYTREITLCWADRGGKSLTGNIILMRRATRSTTAVLITYPDEEVGKRVLRESLRPILKRSQGLKQTLAPGKQAIQATRIDFRNESYIHLAWVGSDTKISAIGYEAQMVDEIDKNPEARNEASFEHQNRARAREYPDTSIIIWASTPTREHAPIWRMLNECRVVYDFHLPCPHCGVMAPMDPEQIKWPEDSADPGQIRDERLGFYECPECGAHWDDIDRDAALLQAEWVAREQVDRPSRVGLHLPAFALQQVGLSECAALKLEAESNQESAKAWANKYCALPYIDIATDRTPEKILAFRRDDLKQDHIPSGTVAVVAGVDTQDYGFYYTIWAWEPGFEGDCHLIRYGFVQTTAALDQVVLESTFPGVDGREYQVNFGMMDTGGHRTEEIYHYTRTRPRIFPVKGSSKRMVEPFRVSIRDKFPTTGRRIPGGLRLYMLDPHYYRDMLYKIKMQMTPGDPGTMWLHADTGRDFAHHMTAQYEDDRGMWQKTNKPDHYADCTYMALAGWHIFNVKDWKLPEDMEKVRPKKQPRTGNVRDQRPSWFGR